MKSTIFSKVLLLCLLLALPALGEGALEDLPLDFTPGHVADPALFTEDSYSDESLTVRVWRETIDGCTFNVADITVLSPSQLRTAVTDRGRTNKISTLARQNHAVVAIGGDYFRNEEGGYVVRMQEVFRKKPRKSHDMLVIDGNGDFHILVKSNAAELEKLVKGDVPLINVFNFGPALVVDSVLQDMPETYTYNIRRPEPRCAIGQLGPLHYLFCVADGRGASGSEGCTVETLARFMADQGCLQAYNLDGGNSALMVFNGENYSSKSFKAERSVSDIIYVATLVDSGLDGD